jgi:PAS domain-containing protein
VQRAARTGDSAAASGGEACRNPLPGRRKVLAKVVLAARLRDPDRGAGRYFTVALRGARRLSELLTHLYVLIPVLDDEKHYFVGEDKPMLDGPRGVAIIRIFAARARAEIERLEAEAAVQISEERLARAIDSAMGAIVTFDRSLRIELFNGAAETVFRCGTSGQSFSGESFRSYIRAASWRRFSSRTSSATARASDAARG